MSTSRRHARQMLLAEIGEDGQRRISAATAAVAGPSLAHEIATTYATRAGMGNIVPGTVDVSRLCPPFLEYPAARAVVAGSRAALAAMRAAVFADREV